MLGDSNEQTCHLHSSTEVLTVNQQKGVLTVNQQNADKFWVLGDSNEQTCHLHFGRIFVHRYSYGEPTEVDSYGKPTEIKVSENFGIQACQAGKDAFSISTVFVTSGALYTLG